MARWLLSLARADRDCLHLLARPRQRYPRALAKSLRQGLKILVARPLLSRALAAALKDARQAPPIADGMGGCGSGHGRSTHDGPHCSARDFPDHRSAARFRFDLKGVQPLVDGQIAFGKAVGGEPPDGLE